MGTTTSPSMTLTVDRRASTRRKKKLESDLGDDVWSDAAGFMCLSSRVWRWTDPVS